MATNRFVGSRLARLSAVALGIVTVTLAAVALAAGTPSRVVFYAAVIAGLATWVSVVHSFRLLFHLWTRFAEGLHTVVVTTIFTVCYLVVVPLFRVVVWFRDPLHLRKPLHETSWVTRTASPDARSLERMG